MAEPSSSIVQGAAGAPGIAEMRIVSMAAKHRPSVQFCMPNRTKCVLGKLAGRDGGGPGSAGQTGVGKVSQGCTTEVRILCMAAK
jgi:hypothetical protein